METEDLTQRLDEVQSWDLNWTQLDEVQNCDSKVAHNHLLGGIGTVVYAVASGLILLCGLSTNGYVLFKVLLRGPRTTSRLLMANMFSANLLLLISFLLFVISFLNNSEWLTGPFTCHLMNFLMPFSQLLHAFSLPLLAMELRGRLRWTKLTLAGCWVLCSTIICPSLFYSTNGKYCIVDWPSAYIYSIYHIVFLALHLLPCFAVSCLLLLGRGLSGQLKDVAWLAFSYVCSWLPVSLFVLSANLSYEVAYWSHYLATYFALDFVAYFSVLLAPVFFYLKFDSRRSDPLGNVEHLK